MSRKITQPHPGQPKPETERYIRMGIMSGKTYGQASPLVELTAFGINCNAPRAFPPQKFSFLPGQFYGMLGVIYGQAT